MKPEGICRTSKKVGYPNRECAETMLGYFNARHKEDNARREDRGLDHAYECPDCGNWHLTSHPRAAWVIEHPPPILQRLRERLSWVTV